MKTEKKVIRLDKLRIKDALADEALNTDELLKLEGGIDADEDDCSWLQCLSSGLPCYTNV